MKYETNRIEILIFRFKSYIAPIKTLNIMVGCRDLCLLVAKKEWKSKEKFNLFPCSSWSWITEAQHEIYIIVFKSGFTFNFALQNGKFLYEIFPCTNTLRRQAPFSTTFIEKSIKHIRYHCLVFAFIFGFKSVSNSVGSQSQQGTYKTLKIPLLLMSSRFEEMKIKSRMGIYKFMKALMV